MREEKDSMGTIRVPEKSYWGAQTQRALENFRMSDLRFSERFIRSIAIIKLAAAEVNTDIGVLDRERAEAICTAAREIMEGKLMDNFILDVFQTGSGTSTNMNVNEVIANRANEILGRKIVHPNDHVNRSQSSNDVIPSAMHMTALISVERDLLPALKSLRESLDRKSVEFMDVVKTGRTHMQDALPVTLGNEFSSYSSAVEHSIERIESLRESLRSIAIGGTAVGTGVNAPEGFRDLIIKRINDLTGSDFKSSGNLFEALAFRCGIASLSSELRVLSTSLIKMVNDIRFLSSGPRCGIGEIDLEAVQPGSSMMPGKVNPVIPEAVAQICARVIGNDSTISLCSSMGNLELNTMMPVMEYCTEESLGILANGCRSLSKCVNGIKANRERCRDMAERSLALVTFIAPDIGYEKAAEIAREAYERDKSVREILLEKGIAHTGELFNGIL